jgi:hypothetical protein
MVQHIIVIALFFTVIAYHGYKFFKRKKEGNPTGKCAKCPSAGKIPLRNE